MALAHILKYRKQPREVVYHGVHYESINSFCKAAREAGYKVKFGSIRYALDHGRDLDEVLAGKKFDKKVAGLTLKYDGKEFHSHISVYRYIKSKNKKVYLTAEHFANIIRARGLEAAVERLTHPKITNASISVKLGGKKNLVILRLKYGWSYERATTTPCKKKSRKPKTN